MDKTVFTDTCHDPEEVPEIETVWRGWQPKRWDCHIAGGWTNGQSTCPLWEKIVQLCQTDPERKFLHRYLSYTKHRQIPHAFATNVDRDC